MDGEPMSAKIMSPGDNFSSILLCSTTATSEVLPGYSLLTYTTAQLGATLSVFI